jgi:peptide methionine sulfoxide reductase msrA/msrB
MGGRDWLVLVLLLGGCLGAGVGADGTAAGGPSAGGGAGAYGRPSEEAIKARLTPLQYHVARENGTETPYGNEYWDNHEEGIYVDIVSGEPLFSSRDKFDSDTGWPSFTRPLVPENIVETADYSLGMARTEVRSRHGDTHLGHLFDDGPPPAGLRYCMNSASLRFIPQGDMEREGYGMYRDMV